MLAAEEPERLTFGPLEPLVALMQETAPEALLPLLVARLKAGTDLKTLTAAAALANARTFGGEDYVGFHTMMALSPAYRMALESPGAERPLPVLKVIWRNTARIREYGGPGKEVLRPVEAATLPEGRDGATVLREAVRARDVVAAERAFASLARGTPQAALDALLDTVVDHAEVHRVVLPWRAWDLLDAVGPEHAHTILRQSVRYCVREEGGRAGPGRHAIRSLLPELLEEHGLLDAKPGTTAPDDAWVGATSRAIFEGTPEEAADRAAAALARGVAPAALGEVLALATVELILRDAGRGGPEARPGKPEGSVHGDSIGVHACDAANAWHHLARAGGPRDAFACLIVGAYQAAADRTGRGGDFLDRSPHPIEEESKAVTASDPEAILRETDAAIRENRQGRACALVARYGGLGHAPGPLQDLLRRHAVREDGALHAEKYYRTATEEFAAARPAFRWRHLVALARVTASEHGVRAPGVEEARRLLEA